MLLETDFPQSKVHGDPGLHIFAGPLKIFQIDLDGSGSSAAVESNAASGTVENERVCNSSRRCSPHRPASRALARKACDACRVRKAKCHTNSYATLGHQRDYLVESAPPCQRCANLSIPCTFLLPWGVRGPRRKYVPRTKLPNPQIPLLNLF